MKTRHLPRVLFKLRFDLRLFDYYGVYGFHLLSEGAQVAFLDAFLLCIVTIIICNFRRDSARSYLAIVIISPSLSYVDLIEKLIQLARILGVGQPGNSDITGNVLHVGRH